jgi:hypothetical protein
MIADKWIEYKPIYETQEHSFCSVCHLDLTANNIVPWKHAEEHMLNGEAGGHYTDSVLVQVGTEEIVHEAVYEKRWIVDKPAWDEKVSTGFKCECGLELCQPINSSRFVVHSLSNTHNLVVIDLTSYIHVDTNHQSSSAFHSINTFHIHLFH